MNALIRSLATDFSVEFADRFGESEPADEYYDPLVKILGKSPSKEDVIMAWRDKIPILRQELSTWLELELDDETIKNVLRHAIVNFYGAAVDIQ
jgi:hypothetical protein